MTPISGESEILSSSGVCSKTTEDIPYLRDSISSVRAKTDSKAQKKGKKPIGERVCPLTTETTRYNSFTRESPKDSRLSQQSYSTWQKTSSICMAPPTGSLSNMDSEPRHRNEEEFAARIRNRLKCGHLLFICLSWWKTFPAPGADNGC